MTRFILVCVLFVGAVCAPAGCQKRSDAESASPPAAPAAVDPASGNLVAFWLQYPDKEEPVLVTEPRAVLMVWRGGDKKFYLFDNTAKAVFKTTNFDAFLRQLDELPHGVRIQLFGTCTAPLTYDMPPEKWQQLMQTLEKGKRGWATSKVNGLKREIICYCETRGLRFP